MAFEVVGTVEVLDAKALEVDDALAVDVDVFPLDVLEALALDEDELLAVDIVSSEGEADVDGDKLEFVGVVSCDDCIDIRDTVLDEEAEAESVELPEVLDVCAELAEVEELVSNE